METPPNSVIIIWRCQIAWGQISFIFGVVGNVFTLYATSAHDAIKLDSLSIWIIKNLAVADICNCILVIFPILLNQYGKINGSIILGIVFVKILTCYRYNFFVANLFLVNILSLNKLLRCVFPLRNFVTTKRQRIIVSTTIVFVSILPTIWTVYGLQGGFLSLPEWWKDPDYSGSVYIGTLSYHAERNSNLESALHWIMIGMLNALPCLTLAILNTSLIVVALAKAKSTVKKTSILTVVLVTVGIQISILPHFVELILKFFDKDLLAREEIVWSISYISTWINPIIYFLVNPTFRKFTGEKLLCFT